MLKILIFSIFVVVSALPQSSYSMEKFFKQILGQSSKSSPENSRRNMDLSRDRDIYYSSNIAEAGSQTSVTDSPRTMFSKTKRKSMSNLPKFTNYSPRKAQVKKVKEIIKIGKVSTDGIIVEDKVKVEGEFQANNCTFGSLNIKGISYLNDCNITNDSNIHGIAVIVGCNFLNSLSVASSLVSIDSSSLPLLYIPKVNEKNATQIVEIKNYSIVYGSISFESGNGEVWIDQTSKLKGIVQGGVVIQK